MKKRLAYSPGRLVAILTFGVFGIINTEMGVVGIIPQIAETFGVTVPQAGWTVGVFALIVAVSAPVMPLLFSGTDRRTGSVVFAYDLNPRYGEQLPSVRLTGLDPDLRYRIREINLMPGQNPRIEHNDLVVSGDYLMKAGLKLFSTETKNRKTEETPDANAHPEFSFAPPQHINVVTVTTQVGGLLQDFHLCRHKTLTNLI